LHLKLVRGRPALVHQPLVGGFSGFRGGCQTAVTSPIPAIAATTTARFPKRMSCPPLLCNAINTARVPSPGEVSIREIT
jgi:hypothetical protein